MKTFLKSFVKIRVPLIYDTKKKGILHKDQYTNTISRRIRLRTRNIPYTSFLQNQKSPSPFNIVFEHGAVYEIMWKNMVSPDRLQTKIWGTHIACWIPEAKTTHSEYVKFIVFHGNRLHERAVLLPLAVIPCLVLS